MCWQCMAYIKIAVTYNFISVIRECIMDKVVKKMHSITTGWVVRSHLGRANFQTQIHNQNIYLIIIKLLIDKAWH